MWCGAWLVIAVLLIAAVNDPAVLGLIGMPDLGAVVSAAFPQIIREAKMSTPLYRPPWISGAQAPAVPIQRSPAG